MSRTTSTTRDLLRSPFPHLMPFTSRSPRPTIAPRPKAEPFRKPLARAERREGRA